MIPEVLSGEAPAGPARSPAGRAGRHIPTASELPGCLVDAPQAAGLLISPAPAVPRVDPSVSTAGVGESVVPLDERAPIWEELVAVYRDFSVEEAMP